MINNRNMYKTGMISLAAISFLAMSAPGTFAATGGAKTHRHAMAATTSQQWTVLVGGDSKSQAFQAMGYFPHVITVDAGDTVNFTFRWDHTVSFPGVGGNLGAQGDFAPAGGHTYDGLTYTSSGMKQTGQVYTLKFTKPGVYPYYCKMHPGMEGVVIVQSAGTPYPMTQAQYNQLAKAQTRADLAAARRAQATVPMMMGKPGPHGTKVWSMFMDAPEPRTYTMNLSAIGASGASGTATLTMQNPGAWQVNLRLSGLKAGKTYTPSLDFGKAASGVAVPGSHFTAFTASSNGTANVTGTVQAFAIPMGTWFVNVLDKSGQPIVGSAVNYPSFAYERFDMGTMHIHVGDTIVWTQLGANEVHTVSFLPAGWKDIPNPSLMPKPAGGSVYRGTGFFNSGFLMPGMSYKLTFMKAGDFQYRCLLHDVFGMYGRVIVTPKKGH